MSREISITAVADRIVGVALELSRWNKLPVRERLAKTLAMAKAAGPMVHLDHKQRTDELWSED